jgi:hypothetical protein
MHRHIFPFDERRVFVTKESLGKLMANFRRFLRRSPKAHRDPRRQNSTRNLIILELESLEQSLLGKFNKKKPRLMPFISNLTDQGIFVGDIPVSLYTSWSVASMFAVQCGLPLLPSRTLELRDLFHFSTIHRCLGDYLDLAGFHLESYLTGRFNSRFRESLQLHKWNVRDDREHNITKDWDMVTHLIDNVIPNLRNVTKPWILHWATWDTHPIPGFIEDSRCANRIGCSDAALRSFDCMDQMIERLFNGIRNSWVWNATDILVYGDHPLLVNNAAIAKQPRKLWLSIPTRPRRIIKKQVTIYDWGPTILDLLGVVYSPKFVLGRSIFDNQSSRILSRDEHEEIYSFFARMNWETALERHKQDTEDLARFKVVGREGYAW